jgi:hypothetical protein
MTTIPTETATVTQAVGITTTTTIPLTTFMTTTTKTATMDVAETTVTTTVTPVSATFVPSTCTADQAFTNGNFVSSSGNPSLADYLVTDLALGGELL